VPGSVKTEPNPQSFMKGRELLEYVSKHLLRNKGSLRHRVSYELCKIKDSSSGINFL
jgi:hypothetical protein